jgi:hypothetical protein
MSPSAAQRLLARVPERRIRLRTGSVLDASRHGPQLQHLSRLLHWLSPLSVLQQEDRIALGLLGLRSKMAELDDEEVNGAR